VEFDRGRCALRECSDREWDMGLMSEEWDDDVIIFCQQHFLFETSQKQALCSADNRTQTSRSLKSSLSLPIYDRSLDVILAPREPERSKNELIKREGCMRKEMRKCGQNICGSSW